MQLDKRENTSSTNTHIHKTLYKCCMDVLSFSLICAMENVAWLLELERQMAKFFVCIMLVSPQQQYQLTWIFLHLSVSASICTWFREVTCQRVGNLFMFPMSLVVVCCLDTIPHFPTFCFLRSLQHELFSSFSCLYFYVASLAVKNDNECFFSLFLSLSSLSIRTIGKTSSVCEFCKSSLSIFCYCDFPARIIIPSNKPVTSVWSNPNQIPTSMQFSMAVTMLSRYSHCSTDLITDWLTSWLIDGFTHMRLMNGRTTIIAMCMFKCFLRCINDWPRGQTISIRAEEWHFKWFGIYMVFNFHSEAHLYHPSVRPSVHTSIHPSNGLVISSTFTFTGGNVDVVWQPTPILFARDTISWPKRARRFGEGRKGKVIAWENLNNFHNRASWRRKMWQCGKLYRGCL